MVDLMYRLPEEPKGREYVINEDIVEGTADMFEEIEKAQKESA